MDIDPTSTAVLAVHVQGDVVSPDGAFAGFFHDQVVKQDTLGAIASVLDAARAAGAHVIYLQVAFAPDYSDLVANCPLLGAAHQMGALKDGAARTEIVAEVAPTDNDTVLKVKRVGGFTDSGLAELLESRGIDTVVLTGVATNLSVEGTARQASDLGYRTVLISDACSAADETTHAASLASMGLLGEIATRADFAAALETQSSVSA